MNGSFVPTQPRGPISAMYSTPGPAYGLPGLVGSVTQHDPRSVHKKGPSYSFGLKSGILSSKSKVLKIQPVQKSLSKLGKFKNDCSPGPVYFPNARITRNGKDGTPAYSLYTRHNEKSNSSTPGAGAYMPESQGVMASVYHKVPSYTFGSKHNQRGSFNTPAANYYTLPGMLGHTVQSQKTQAPNYSITGRSNVGSFHHDLQKVN